MARLRRHYVPGLVHHVISRFHGGEYRLRDQVERDEYLRRLALGLDATDWVLLAFALMSTHVHLVLLAGLLPPAKLFQSAHSAFANWLNAKQNRPGHLVADRPNVWTVRRPPAELIAYVHNNPVRAKVVDNAAKSTWTSHRFYQQPFLAPKWLDVELGMRVAGFSCPKAFDDYVHSVAHKPRDIRWQGDVDREVLKRAHEVGGTALELEEPVVADTVTYGLLLRPEGYAEVRCDCSPEHVLDAVAHVLAVPTKSFRGRSKTRVAARGRRLALRVWRSMRGPQADMCAALGMSSSAACELLRSAAAHHRAEDEERVWAELLRRYPQKI